MVKLVLVLAVISLLASCLQVSSGKPVVHKEDENSENGYEDKEGNDDDMTGLGTGDDEDYSNGSGSGSGNGGSGSGSGNGGSGYGILILTQEEIWKYFKKYSKKLGYSIKVPSYSQ